MTTSAHVKLAIFCPLAFERAVLERWLKAREAAAPGEAQPIDIIQTGPGAAMMRDVVGSCLRAMHVESPDLIAVLVGVGGGLVAGADSHVFGEAVDAAGNRWSSPLDSFSDKGLTVLGLNEPAFEPSEKARWREESGACIVDTESHAFAEVCRRAGVPWLVIRGVSDQRHESLPRAATQWVNSRGDTVGKRVAADLLRSPGLLPQMMRLGRRGSRAMHQVTSRLDTLVPRLLSLESLPRGEVRVAPLPLAPGSLPFLLLFGGSFDPPHLAHVELPLAVRDELERGAGLEDQGGGWILYVPAARSPLKRTGPVGPDQHRVHMLRLALRGVDRAGVWADEIQRSHHADAETPSYTIDTVVRLRAALDDRDRAGGESARATPIRLLIGADQAAKFHLWREARRLLELAEPVVMLRVESAGASGVSASSVEARTKLMRELAETGEWSDDELRAWESRIVDVGVRDISSTKVRELLASAGEAEARARLSTLLHADVLEYAVANELYKAV